MKGIVYYTGNKVDLEIMGAVQRQLLKSGLPIVSVSLEPISFGENVVLDLEPGVLTMFRQILAGIEASREEIIFLAEDDMLYHKSHFDFTPTLRNLFYYNVNSWKVHYVTGQALFYYCQQTGFIGAYRELLLEHYRERVRRVEKEGFRRWNGYEPGGHGVPRGYCNSRSESWRSVVPNIDIRHSTNLTWSRWSKDQFRNPVKEWQEADEVPGWGLTKGKFQEVLRDI